MLEAIKMLGEYETAKSEEEQNHLLQFTGNWFIDAGVLGFVNLMEEVYGWDLKEIVRSIDREKFYYTYFIYYIKKTTFDWINRQDLSKGIDEDKKSEFNKTKENLFKEIEKIIEKILKSNSKDKNVKEQIIEVNDSIRKAIKDSFKEYKDYLKKSFSNNKKTILQKIDEIGIIINEPFFQNLNFLNPTKNKKGKEIEVLNAFEKMIFEYKIKDKLTKNALDKTISKYLFSEEEFTNIPYCKIQTLNDLDKLTNYPSIIFLLSFPIVFNRIFDRNIFFYTNNLESCYHINKNIKIRIGKAENRSSDAIFKITWESIIDYITEQKGIFSLENMYLIEYENIQQQNLIGVEYIGIPKLQASILLDDTIRENLNRSIQYRKIKKQFEWKWLLEEFIKGKPLYPIILGHINLALNEEIIPNLSTCLYSLILEANMSEFKAEKEKQNGNLFSENYFDNYKSLINEIKEDLRFTSFKASLINQISKDMDTKKRIARELFNALKARDKNIFLNILLKNMNEDKKLYSNDNLNSWIFEKIIKNDISFEMYCLILVMNLLRGEKR